MRPKTNSVAIKEKSKVRTNRCLELYEELAKIIHPLEFIKNRRARLASYPGDGREHGLALFALYRLLGADFNRRKVPPVESDEDRLLKAGIQTPDHSSYVTLMTLIVKLPQSTHSKQKSKICNLSNGSPPPESLLPPTLHTLTGLRGLFIYRNSLKSQGDISV